MRLRRMVALGVGALVLVGLVLLIKGCRDSARIQSFKDYVRNVSQMVDQSNSESSGLFRILSSSAGQTPVELQTSANGYRTDAAGLVLRAKTTGRPDELAQAQAYLIEVLELRRDGIGSIADQLPSALAGGQNQGAPRIAAAMQDFLASDVLFRQRVIPSMESTLAKAGLLAGTALPHSRFLPDLGWIDGATAAGRLATLTGGNAGNGGVRQLAIGTVTANPGGQTLNQASATQLSATPTLTFVVTVTNQGAYAQHDVVVRLQVSGGSTPIQVEQKIPSIDPGSQGTATIPLAATPPTGRPATVQVQIVPAPATQDTGTTKVSFPVSFAG